jgi:hypothetical protein
MLFSIEPVDVLFSVKVDVELPESLEVETELSPSNVLTDEF